MNEIINNEKNEIVIKKSRFIAFSYKIYHKEEIKPILQQLKNEYKDARHICYAYLLDYDGGYSDDQEPAKTAGFPMLEVLRLNNINHILIVCIRYFGGIKLGSNGLIRAYSKSCSEVIKKSGIKKACKLITLHIQAKIEDYNKILYLLKKYDIASKTLMISEEVKLDIYLPETLQDTIINELKRINFTINYHIS